MIYAFASSDLHRHQARHREEQQIHREEPGVALIRRVLPVKRYEPEVLHPCRGRLRATPSMVLVFLELTDVMFALDSVPAIIVTRDSFIVYV
jgi:predicted tellurium resistance membrane protein TerC